MIVMIDSSENIDLVGKEIGYPAEQLFTPASFRRNHHPGRCFAIDNGSFNNFEPQTFQNLLKRERPNIDLCRFVAVPDRVANAIETLELFYQWLPILKEWPLAFVCQDGIEQIDIPWHQIKAIFIGGTTPFKESDQAIKLIREAKDRKKWIHVGRVNTPARFEACVQLEVDSVDGTGIARYSHMRKAIADRNHPDRLFSMADLVNVK